eukprot:7250899-Prymnesium_polylepis.1
MGTRGHAWTWSCVRNAVGCGASVEPPELTAYDAAIDAADVEALLRADVGPLRLWHRRDGAARPQLALMVGGEVVGQTRG